MHRAVVGEIVGQIEHRVHQRLVSLDAVASIRLMTRARLDDEAALRAERDDDRVLDGLGLHQIENLGAVVIVPVAEANSAAREATVTQMASFHARTVDVNFVERRGVGQAGDARAFELERDVPVGRRRGAEEIRTHRSLYQRQQRARRAVVDDIFDRAETLQVRRPHLLDFLRRGRAVEGETGAEQLEQQSRHFRIQQENALQGETRGRQAHLERGDEIRAQDERPRARRDLR